MQGNGGFHETVGTDPFKYASCMDFEKKLRRATAEVGNFENVSLTGSLKQGLSVVIHSLTL